MTKNISVSVVIPTFNRAKYLPVTLSSVYRQTAEDIEVIVVDDGSTDETRALLEVYRNEQDLRYFHQENSGQSVARNVGWRAAKGENICFLDSDDKLNPDAIEVMLKVIRETPSIDVVCGNVEVIDEDGNYLEYTNIKRHSGLITEFLLRDNCVSMNSHLVRRSAVLDIGGFDESLSAADDWDFWLRMSVHHRFLYIPKVMSQYRLSESQISHNSAARFASNEKILKKFIAANPEIVNRQLERKTWCDFLTRKGRFLASQGKLWNAFTCYLEAIIKNPLSIGPWRALARLFVLRK